MNRKTLSILAVIIAIPALALAYWLISPLFRDDEVNEDFAFAIEIPDGMSESDAKATMDASAEKDMPEVQDEMPEEVKDMPEDEQVALKILTGEFQDQDSVHQGSGNAFIFELPDGSHVLRFEDFRVTNGPDLNVFLSTSGSIDDAINLGNLKGNVGNQNYDIPIDFDVNQAQTVIIYCVPFHVVFSTAVLTPPSVQ